MKGMKRLIAAGLSAILTLAMLPISMGTTSVQAATTKATTISNPYVKNGKVVYDCVYFGNYWQKDTNGDGEANKQDKKSPIKWRVLSVDGSKALLVADQVLDVQLYNDTNIPIAWADCTMRKWLNGTFKNNAFSGSEQKAIQATTIANMDQRYGTEGGVNTKDSVFLLSLEDIANTKYGFSNFDLTNWEGDYRGFLDGYEIYDFAKLRTVTAFASGSDTATEYSSWKPDIGTNDWWLCSPNDWINDGAAVNACGYVHGYVTMDFDYGLGVVPALYLNLSSTANYTYAGTVSCDGNGIAYNEKATGNGGSGSYTIGATSETVAISKTKASLEVGKTVTLKITGTTDTVKWTSSDSKIAKVNSKGKVTAVKAGKATITATVGGKKYKCVVTVTEPVKLSKTKASLEVGKTVTLKITGTTDTVKWTSGDSKIAKVNSKGKVTAVKAGKATITATVGGKKYNCVVTVTKAATTKATTISNPYVKNGKVVYDCVYFGNYWQKDTNGDGKANKQDKKSPIKWRVLSVDGSKALLVADQVLDVQRYNETYTDITWADCTMRTWLNGTFKNNAFTSSEQKAIQATTIANKDNQYYGTEGGVNTKDSVFLLSLEDIANTKYGFSNFDLTNWNGGHIGKIGDYWIYDFAKLCTVTAFANGSDTATGYSFKSGIGTNWWWLRSPGRYSETAAIVDVRGYVDGGFSYVDGGYGVGCDLGGVVPALYLNLSSTANYTYAGTVSCDGNGIEYNEKATGNGGSGSYTIGATSE